MSRVNFSSTVNSSIYFIDLVVSPVYFVLKRAMLQMETERQYPKLVCYPDIVIL
jgi:hypothetical protein